MSNGSPPITEAPVPPSIPGIPQPVFESGSATVPAAGPITGSPIIPPPTIGDPVGFPVFPPVDPDFAPIPVPVGPLVGPAVGPAPVPPSVAGVQQPQFVPPGSATVPASLFPDFTTAPPSPPIVFANIFKIGAVPPPLPSTPGQNPPPIVPSPVPTIPQLPWNPNPVRGPVNTARPTITGTPTVGSLLTSTTGTWTGTGTIAYAREWTRNGSPITGATAPTYTVVAADYQTTLGVNVTASDNIGDTSATALPFGPIVASAPVNTVPPDLTVGGQPNVGSVVTRSTGTWTGYPTPTYSQQWYRGSTSPPPTVITGATATTYTLVAADLGLLVNCRVSATNSEGSATANSNTIGPVISLLADEDPTPLPSGDTPVRHRHAPPKKKR